LAASGPFSEGDILVKHLTTYFFNKFLEMLDGNFVLAQYDGFSAFVPCQAIFQLVLCSETHRKIRAVLEVDRDFGTLWSTPIKMDRTDCEQLFNREGENWFCPLLPTVSGPFPLRERVMKSRILYRDETTAIFQGQTIPK
jgi:hypothetical protein